MAGLFDQTSCQGRVLTVCHHPAHHVTAEDVEQHVEVGVRPLLRAQQFGVGVEPQRPGRLSPTGFLRPALRTGRAIFTASGSPRNHAESASRVPVGWPPVGQATVRRYSSASSSLCIPAATTLEPFAMYAAFLRSDYYDSSAPHRQHQLATSLPYDRQAARGCQCGSHVHFPPFVR